MLVLSVGLAEPLDSRHSLARGLGTSLLLQPGRGLPKRSLQFDPGMHAIIPKAAQQAGHTPAAACRGCPAQSPAAARRPWQ